jgi:hypothetical protein
MANGYQHEKESRGILGYRHRPQAKVDNRTGAGDKSMHSKWSQPQMRLVWTASQFWFWRVSGAVIWRVLYSEQSLLLGVVSVPCHKDAIDHLCPFFTVGWL